MYTFFSKGHPFIKQYGVGLLILMSCSFFAIPVWARKYQPPTGSPPDSSVSNGSRPTNCDASSTIPLTVLAPLDHVGRVSSLDPTFSWFLSATSPYRLNVSLFQTADTSVELLHELEFVEKKSGINQYTIPLDKSELQFGKRYFLQVSVACQPNQPTYNQSFVVQFETLAPSQMLLQKLDQANTTDDRASLYAESGFWYDALREALAEVEAGHSQPTVELLQSLAESEMTSHAGILSQIANSLQTLMAEQ